jgi:hypothetical protein
MLRLQSGQRLGAVLDRRDLHVRIADQLDDAVAQHLLVLDHQQVALAAGQELLDARELLFQALAVDRLHQVRDRALAQAALALGHVRQDVHRDMARARVAFQAVQHGEAVRVRQVDVEDDRGRQVVARQRQRRVAGVPAGTA